MTPVLIVIHDGVGDLVDRLVVDDTGTGPEIRRTKDCKIAADRSIPVDLVHQHCDSCCENMMLEDRLDLTSDEADVLIRWRTRKEDGVSAAQLGEILDKVVKALRAPDPVCETEHERILLRVESTNG